MTEQWFYVGKIVNTQGIKGEVRVVSITDFPEERYAVGATLYVQDPKTDTYEPLKVKSYRRHKQFDCLTFENYHSINDIEKYKGRSLFVSKEQLSNLEQGTFYYHEIIGSQVITDTGRHLGEVKEILSPGANDVWVVDTGVKNVLIPYIADVVKDVDVAQKKVTVHLIPGLVDDED
ncbi:ribosome maturation factor RimM [Sporolactobacillus shoreicorticis]|uniref:Ribosome maturation factor RimM n=1 Tax=Sporolactobacillus shoreicorticis TaxID=1923877 RepID=A0ABW5S214_9BACL|nr:ribosome maturation factor RimM [Sporolactobacillus shoreicorticis]MCO7127959.1 ribosome maturation factor RimM [Sporolactobacillus shoreicorticis]